MDASHLIHFYPEYQSAPESISEGMDSSSGHILDQYIDGEQMDLNASSYVLPLRPLLSNDNTQTKMDDVQEAVQEAIQDAIREVLQSETTSPDLGNAGHSQPETQELISELTDAKSNSNVKLSRKLALETLSKPPSGPPPDTLVFIDYPNTAKFSEFVGTTSPLRVHSVNLLATGSTEFRDLLSPTKNFRTIRRRKLVNQLPTGIIYVIDLTPPDEGDEAVNLTADLSLSLGIQQWYTMKKKARILNVGGSDESADSDLIPLLILKSSTRPRKTFGDPSGGKYSALKDHFRQSLLRPEASPPYSESLNAPRTLAESKSDLDTAVALSQTTEQNQGGFGSDEREVPEYSNIRHRLGIQRLLQVIEGKDPDLDSAPKVWTLCILAKYFDCTISVVDHISKWLLAEPNSLFIEVLPEMSAKIGLSLQTHAVTRAAFSVLVGEEALALICRRRSQLEPELPGATRFGRRKEDIDEDLKNRIEYASKAFEERISSTFEKFFNRNLDWLDQLPEFKKITQFQQAIDESREKGRFQWEQCVQTLRHFINSFIRRRILCALDASMVHTAFGKTFTDHRNLEALDLPSWMIGEPVFMYDQLTMPERVFTRPFWIQLRTMGFTLDSSYSGNHYLDRMGSEFARQEGIELVTHSGLITATRNFGEAVIEAISAGCLNGGQIPPEAIWNNTAKTDVEKEEDTVRNIKENVNSLKLVAEGWSDSQSPVPLVGSWDPTPKPESPTGNRGRMFIGGEFNSSDERSDVSPDNCSTRAIYNGIEENTTSRNRFAIHGYDTLAPNISADKPSVNFNNRLAIHELQPVAPEILVADPFANINNHMGLPNVPPPPPGLPMITHPTFTPSNPPISKLGMTVPESGFICEDSPFLNLSLLLSQVDDYISKLCQTMLSTNTMGFDINTTDVLLCLTDNEFRYLPVFAGGQDDGTGLVFTDPVPEATNGLAPIGPGPSFRTGFSMTDSSMGSVDGRSEFSYGADTETSSDLDQGSKIVEDGYSGIFPRMRMAVGSDVASVAWSGGEDTGTEVGFGDVLGKGKEVVKGKPGEIPTVFTPSSSVIGDDDNVTIAGDSNSDPIHGMRDVDMDNETVVDGDLDHDMTDTPMENMTTTTTASALTVMDADFSSYDYTYSYGYEENADEDEGDDQAEAEDDDNDITISDAGDVGVDDGDDREGKSEGKVDREGGEGSDDFRFDDGDLIAL